MGATTELCNCPRPRPRPRPRPGLQTNTNTNNNNSNSNSNNDDYHCSCYCRTSYFRLRFLRCEFFDIRKSAIRYCKCLNVLLKHFGDSGLQRQLYISDLNRDELKCLKAGEQQLLPSRDRMGRRIVYSIRRDKFLIVDRSIRIIVFLLCSVLAEDVTSQKNGTVCAFMMGLKEIKGGSSSTATTAATDSMMGTATESGSHDDGDDDDDDKA